MKKKLAWMLALVLLLAAVCAVAVAEEKTQISAGGLDSNINKGLSATEKGIVLRPARGATIDLFVFGNMEGCIDRGYSDSIPFYDMKTGKPITNIWVNYIGRLRLKVESGSHWIDGDVYSNGNYGFYVEYNNATTQRSGVIVLSDTKGTVLRIRITQSSDVKIKSVKQLNGAKHDREIRVQTSRVQGVNGKVIYWSAPDLTPCGDCWRCQAGKICEEYEDFPGIYKPVKYTKGTIWFHQNRAINQYHFYQVELYRVIAGRRLISDTIDHYEYGPGVIVTH